jgi:hypothetical protein
MRAALASLLLALSLLFSGGVSTYVSDGQNELTQPLAHKALLVREQHSSSQPQLVSGKSAKRAFGPLPSLCVLPSQLDLVDLLLAHDQPPLHHGPFAASGAVHAHTARAPPVSLVLSINS